MLETIPIFSDLPTDECQALAEQAVVRTYPRNAVILTEGDVSDSLYIIRSGRVKVYLNDEQGREVILNFQEKGEYFGELALLDDSPRTASVMTVEPSEFAIISKAAFSQCIMNHPAIAIHLIRALVQRIRGLAENVRELALSEVYERVARLLVRMAREEDGRQFIPRKLTHQELANMVGSSREMVTRILGDLSKGGYISIEGKIITLNRKLPERW